MKLLTKFEAFDGSVHDTESACRAHEAVVQASIGLTPDQWLTWMIPQIVEMCRKMKGEAVN